MIFNIKCFDKRYMKFICVIKFKDNIYRPIIEMSGLYPGVNILSDDCDVYNPIYRFENINRLKMNFDVYKIKYDYIDDFKIISVTENTIWGTGINGKTISYDSYRFETNINSYKIELI